jgi:hypothetical protein
MNGEPSPTRSGRWTFNRYSAPGDGDRPAEPVFRPATGMRPGAVPARTKQAFKKVAQFALDDTFYMNAVFAQVAAVLVWMNKRHSKVRSFRVQNGVKTPFQTFFIFATVCRQICGMLPTRLFHPKLNEEPLNE